MAALPSPVMSRAPSNTVTLGFRVWPTAREDHANTMNRLAAANKQSDIHFTRSIVASLEKNWIKSGARVPRV
jgi:hypothetical protein